MFTNIGKKIKTLAKTWCWILIILNIIGGIILYVMDDDLIGFALLLALGGSLLAYIGSFVLYGFGELVDKTCDIERNTRGANTPNAAPVGINTSAPQKKHQFLGKCEMCDKTDTMVREAKIVDKDGTRYRKVCDDCFAKYDCKEI